MNIFDVIILAAYAAVAIYSYIVLRGWGLRRGFRLFAFCALWPVVLLAALVLAAWRRICKKNVP